MRKEELLSALRNQISEVSADEQGALRGGFAGSNATRDQNNNGSCENNIFCSNNSTCANNYKCASNGQCFGKSSAESTTDDLSLASSL